MSSTALCYPACQSNQNVKNGKTHIDEATKRLVDKLLLEKLSLAGIARVVEVSEGWIQGYVNGKYKAIPRHIDVNASKKGY